MAGPEVRQSNSPDEQEIIRNPEDLDEKRDKKAAAKKVYEGFSSIKEEAARLAERRTRNELQTAAFRYTVGKDRILDPSDLIEFQKRMDEAGNLENPAEKAAEFENIQNDLKETIERKKAEQKDKDAKNTEDSKELPPDDPKLLDLQKEFDQTCDTNINLIGVKQVPGFKAWFKEQRQKKPTVKYLTEQLKRLKGEINDEKGLAPRKEEFGELQKLFSKYELRSPLDNPWIKMEGLKERKEFRKNAEEMETELRTSIPNFYSREAKVGIMKEILSAKNPHEQKHLLNQFNDIKRLESEGFTHMTRDVVDVGGRTVRKMSDSSIKAYLDGGNFGAEFGHRNQKSIKKRLESLNKVGENGIGIKAMVENEGKLATDLGKIFKDDQKGLNLALDSFEKMDFMEKQKALVKFKEMVEKESDKEVLHKKLTIKAAETSIKEAKSKEIISAKTASNYIKFFNKKENFKDEKTAGAEGALTLEDSYRILVSPTAQDRYKNLAAYEKRKKSFTQSLTNLTDINPDIDDKEIEKWHDKYMKEGWTDREKIHEELKRETEKQKENRRLVNEANERADITDEEKEKTKERDPQKSETILSAVELMAENKPEDAMRILALYISTLPQNKPIDSELKLMLELCIKQDKENKQKEEYENSAEEKAKEKVDKLFEGDKNKDRLKRLHVESIRVEAERQNEKRYDNVTDAKKRTEKIAIKEAKNEDERELAEGFYSLAREENKNKILDEEGKAEEEQKIKVTGEITTEHLSKTDSENLYRKTQQQQENVFDKKKGIIDTTLTDKDGHIIKSETASEKLKKEEETLSKSVAKEATQNMDRQVSGTVKDSDTFLESFDKIAQERAKRRIKEEEKERLEKR